MQLEAAEELSASEKSVIVVLMCLAATAEGMDGAVFPAVTTALIEFVNFDVSNIASMSSAQSLVQAFSGPFWGIVGSRAILRRRDILFLGAFVQGLATVVMPFFITSLPIMMVLRAINGFALAALRPVANSVIADTFDDVNRGTMFGLVQMSTMLGSGFAGILATSYSRVDFGFAYGWRLAFWCVGGFTAMLGPVIFILLKEPLVKVDKSKEGGVMLELYTLVKLMKKYTFACCVIQGCFGLIPWKAFEFRPFFFQAAGLTDQDSGVINTMGMFAAAAGNLLGGSIGDLLSRVFGSHGRVMTAEISIFGGIPVAYVTFMVAPSPDNAYAFFAATVIALGIIGTWTPAGANSPILCSIASENERTLVLAWQISLEGAVGSLGPVMFTILLTNVFAFNPLCITDPAKATDCENSSAAGNALFWTSCVPWTICGLIYSTMHLSYPRDLAAQIEQNQERLDKEQAGAALTGVEM